MCFFFNDTATTEIYTLSLHDALPILIFDGLTVKFRVIVTNTGAVGLTNASVSDNTGLVFAFGGNPTFTLAAGASITSDLASTTALDGHHFDTATVTGTASDGVHTTTVSANDQADYTGISPSIAIDKQVSVDGGASWQDVTNGVLNDPLIFDRLTVKFRVIVTNTGAVGLTNASVSDNTGLVFAFGGNPTFTLAAGASITSDLASTTALDGHHFDTATVTGTASDFFFNDTATTEIYTLSLHDAPPISIDKQVSVDGGATWKDVGNGVLNDPLILDGLAVKFRVIVTNTGAVGLTNASVSDNTGLVFAFGGNPTFTLAAGASITSALASTPALHG